MAASTDGSSLSMDRFLLALLHGCQRVGDEFRYDFLCLLRCSSFVQHPYKVRRFVRGEKCNHGSRVAADNMLSLLN